MKISTHTYDDPEQLFTLPSLEELIQRGGAGSGNFGHAGRPGKVGGSAPRGGGAPAKKQGWSFKENVDVRLQNDFQDRNMVAFNNQLWDVDRISTTIDFLVAEHNIPPEHLMGLTRVTVGTADTGKFLNNPNAVGLYFGASDGLGDIYLLGDYFNEPINAHTFFHELGHHVYNKLRQVDRSVVSDTETMFAQVKGEYPLDQPGTDLKQMWWDGLREYSLTNASEFFADSYAAYAESRLFPESEDTVFNRLNDKYWGGFFDNWMEHLEQHERNDSFGRQ